MRNPSARVMQHGKSRRRPPHADARRDPLPAAGPDCDASSTRGRGGERALDGRISATPDCDASSTRGRGAEIVATILLRHSSDTNAPCGKFTSWVR